MSQAKLVGRDIAGELSVPGRCPVRIVQANGDPDGGGAEDVELRVIFPERVQLNDEEKLVWRVTGLFHEADMEDEMILSYRGCASTIWRLSRVSTSWGWVLRTV